MARKTSKKKSQLDGAARRQKVNAPSTKSPHKSFKRTYREDYVRELEVPGMGHQIYESFRLFFKNWKIFLPLILIATVVMVGLMGFVKTSEYADAAMMVVAGVMIAVTWLATIFVIRHEMNGQKVGLRDTLYNGMTPLISTVVVLVLAAVQAVPVMLLIIAYSSAIETHFLDTPFYAFLFLTFAFLMILLTAYLWSGTLMALVAVSAPGLYPWEALKAANEMMMGRRIKFILRIIALLIVLFIISALTIVPMANLVGESPATSVVLNIIASFSVIYAAIYLYIYYRWMLDADL